MGKPLPKQGNFSSAGGGVLGASPDLGLGAFFWECVSTQLVHVSTDSTPFETSYWGAWKDAITLCLELCEEV